MKSLKTSPTKVPTKLKASRDSPASDDSATQVAFSQLQEDLAAALETIHRLRQEKASLKTALADTLQKKEQLYSQVFSLQNQLDLQQKQHEAILSSVKQVLASAKANSQARQLLKQHVACCSVF